MFGISFALACARQLQMPLVICIGLGNNQGTHQGKNPLALYMDSVTRNHRQLSRWRLATKEIPGGITWEKFGHKREM